MFILDTKRHKNRQKKRNFVILSGILQNFAKLQENIGQITQIFRKTCLETPEVNTLSVVILGDSDHFGPLWAISGQVPGIMPPPVTGLGTDSLKKWLINTNS